MFFAGHWYLFYDYVRIDDVLVITEVRKHWVKNHIIKKKTSELMFAKLENVWINTVNTCCIKNLHFTKPAWDRFLYVF